MGGGNHHIPAEIVEKILLKLSVKSLVRFSSVSKSWKAMIFDPGFARKHHSCGAIPRGERMAISPSELRCGYLDVSSCSFSSISDTPIKDSRNITCPIQGNPFLHAFCDELWCVQVDDSLFLWNPTLNTYEKLSDPSVKPGLGADIFESVYGLGYDSVREDYVILKINKHPAKAELYSLRNDSWRTIQPFSPNSALPRKVVFATGAFYWMVHLDDSPAIVSFDLSNEEYKQVERPGPYQYPPTLISDVEMVALRGKFCVSLTYHNINRFLLWAREHYGVEKSWTVKLDIDYSKSLPYFLQRYASIMAFNIARFRLRPVCLYGDGGVVVKVSGGLSSGISEVFLFRDAGALPEKLVDLDRDVSDAFVYVESLVSPAMWSASSDAGVEPAQRDPNDTLLPRLLRRPQRHRGRDNRPSRRAPPLHQVRGHLLH